MRVCIAWMLGAAVAAAVLTARAGDDDPPDDPPEPTTPLARVVNVVRDDGKPFVGVTVFAYGAPGGTLTKTTGDDGSVRFDAMPRKGVTFVVRRDGFYPSWHEPGAWWWHMPEEDTDPDGDGVTEMTFGLTPGTVYEGRVVAKDGVAPIAGATVEAYEDATATDQNYLEAAPIWTATTNAHGDFRTESGRPKDHRPKMVVVRVTARAPGFISETIEGDKSPTTFRLLAAATLSGVVTGADGKPAAGVDVYAYPSGFGAFHTGAPENRRHDKDEHPRVLEVRTGADGRYEMPELHPGTKFFVYAERNVKPPGDEFALETCVERSEVTPGVTVAKAGGATTCDLKLRALSSLVVIVEEDAGGASKPWCTLDRPARTLPWEDDEESPGGRTWSGLDPGRHVLHVGAEGWAPLTRTVDVPPGDRVELRVRLDRGVALEGTVVDDRGLPVDGIGVSAYPVGGSGRSVGDAKTDAAGAFRITGLAPGTVHLQAFGDGYDFEEKVRAMVPSSGTRLVVVREPRIRLIVVAPPGGTLPGKVRAQVIDVSGRYAGMRDERIIPSANLPAILDRVRPGWVDVTVDVPGHAPSTLRIVLKPGETADVGPFEFEDGVELAGRVVDAEGNPVAGARVTPYEHETRAFTAGVDGAFVLPHLAAGSVDLAVNADGYPETRLDAAPGVPLEIVLRPGGVVRATVRSKGHDRVDQRRFCVYAASATSGFVPHWHPELKKDGTFRLPAGKYRFVPSRYEFDKDAVLFEVTEGGETVVEFVVP